MKKCIKKSLSIFLSLIMIMALPVSVYAETGNEGDIKNTYTFIDISGKETSIDGASLEEALNNAPDNTASVCKSNNDGTHTITPYKWATSDSNSLIINEIVDEENTKSEECSFEEIEITTPATCTTEGVKTSTCTVCGGTKTETIPITDHTWDNGENTTQATCTEEGVKTFTCTACGEIKTEIFPATGHKFIKTSYNSIEEDDAYVLYTCEDCKDEYKYITDHNWDEGTVVKEATCTEDGVRIYTCTGTNCHETKAEMIPKIEHTYVAEVTPPTCTEQGYTTYTCACGGSYIDDYVDKTGHKEVIDEAVAATCTESGLSEGSHCSVCNTVLVEQKEVPTIEHTIVTDEAVAATCTESGLSEGSHCSVCNTVFVEQTTIPAARHTSVVTQEAVAPTCETVGYKQEVKCSVCEEIIEARTEISALGHNWSSEGAKCTECGVPDTIKKINKVEIQGNTKYFVGDTWHSTLKLEVEFEGFSRNKEPHIATITTDDYLFAEKFSTALAGEKLYSVKYGDITLENAVEITVAKPKLTVKTTSGDTVYNDYSYVLGDKGIRFKAQSNTGDKIRCVRGSNLSVSLSKGVYTVKPTKYFTINAKNYKNYYVTFYFERNGNKYATKLYFSCGIVGLKCITAASTYTQGSSVTKTLKFRQTYIDGTTGQFSVKKALPTKSVGKKTVDYSYYGEKAIYTYYVKCKTPTLAANGKSKAVSLSWKKIPGATGYKIYRATSKNGKYTAIKTINKGSTTYYKNTGLKSRKTYYYKIKAVYSKNAKCNSSFSAVRSCKTK